jgi:hypothetical protein
MLLHIPIPGLWTLLLEHVTYLKPHIHDENIEEFLRYLDKLRTSQESVIALS